MLSIASPRAKPGRQDAAHVCALAPALALAPLRAFHLWALRQFSPGSVILTLRAAVGAPPPSFAVGDNSPQYLMPRALGPDTWSLPGGCVASCNFS